MQLRRSLLLFAILLGLAALAASIASPGREGRRSRPSPPPGSEPPQASSPSAAPDESTVRFVAGGRPATRTLATGQAADVTVAVREAGQVELEGLGLTQAAEPVTPASFQVLVERPGRFEVRFDPAGQRGSSLVGTLVARPRPGIK
jgi:hypothetical protein